jgi:hypothetical protein
MSFLKPVVLGLMAITVDLVCQPAHARAQESFPPASEEVILWSARSCYAEATWSLADCTALLHVIRKRSERANWSFLKMLKQYSVSNWLQSSHGKRAARLKLADNPGQTTKWNQNWRALVDHVTAVLAHSVTDPCPRADHWAAVYYVPRSPMRRVRCTQKVANAFWVSVRG